MINLPEIYLVRSGNWYVTTAELKPTACYKYFHTDQGKLLRTVYPDDIESVTVGALEDAEYFTNIAVASAAAQAVSGVVLKADRWEPVKADE